MDVLLVGNDQLVKVLGVKDADTGAFITSATVTAVLKNLNGVEVSGQTWPLLLTWDIGSDGNYEGVLLDTVILQPNSRYIVEVNVDGGPGRKGFWHFTRPALFRKFD